MLLSKSPSYVFLIFNLSAAYVKYYISCTYLPISVIMCLEAIESGHLPGDILDDIPVKYVDGSLLCEVILIYVLHALLLKAAFKFLSIRLSFDQFCNTSGS